MIQNENYTLHQPHDQQQDQSGQGNVGTDGLIEVLARGLCLMRLGEESVEWCWARRLTLTCANVRVHRLSRHGRPCLCHQLLRILPQHT